MSTNKKRTISLIFVLLSALGLIFWFYLAKPTSFYSENVLIHIINETDDVAYANEIQDIIYVDDKHVFVPFISKRNEYGVSFWKWKHHKWKIINIIDKGGTPRLWKIKPNDPSSYAMFWNFNPEDRVHEIKFRFINSRGYQTTDDISTYTPSIRMEQKVSLKNNTYGYLKYPKNWAEIQKLEKKIGTHRNVLYLNEYGFPTSIQLSMNTYNKEGKEIYPENSINGNDYIVEDELFDYIFKQDDKEVEGNPNY